MTNIELTLFKQLADQSEDITFIYDPNESRFLYVNKAFEIITKKKCSELLSKPNLLLKIIHKDDLIFVKKNYKILLGKTTCSLLNFRIIRSDSTERWLRSKIYPILKENKIQYLTGVAEDDSARKATIFNMQKVNGWKDSNLEILSHDLRGPIGTVKILASLIAKKIPENKEIHKLTGMIEEISKRNITLIQALLKREALDTAVVELSPERIDVVWEIHQVTDIFIKSQEALKKQILFNYSHEKLYAEVDSMKFLQIINNLISNAIKFTNENGKITIHAQKLEKTFLVTVVDDGIGIPKSLQPILFTKYTKAGRTGIEGEESIGLGMWIIKLLTEQHGGRVWFESKPNKGSTFYVEIPLGL